MDLIKDNILNIDDLKRLMNYDNGLQSIQTIKNYFYNLKKFERHLNGKVWEEVTKQDIIDYTIELKKTGLSNESINNYVKAIKRFYNMAIDRKLLSTNPAENVQYFKEKKVSLKHKWVDEETMSIELFCTTLNITSLEKKTGTTKYRYKLCRELYYPFLLKEACDKKKICLDIRENVSSAGWHDGTMYRTTGIYLTPDEAREVALKEVLK